VFRDFSRSKVESGPGVVFSPAKSSEDFRSRAWMDVLGSCIAFCIHSDLQVLFKLFHQGFFLLWRDQAFVNQISKAGIVNVPLFESCHIHLNHFFSGAKTSSMAFCAFFMLCLSISISTLRLVSCLWTSSFTAAGISFLISSAAPSATASAYSQNY